MAPEPTVSRRGRRRRRNSSRLAACCGWQSGMLGCQAPGSAQNACHVALHVAFKAALRTRQGRRGSGSLWLSFWPCTHLPLVPGPITAQEARHASDQSVRQVVQRHSPHTERHSAHMRAFLFLKQSGQGRWALPILSRPNPALAAMRAHAAAAAAAMRPCVSFSRSICKCLIQMCASWQLEQRGNTMVSRSAADSSVASGNENVHVRTSPRQALAGCHMGYGAAHAVLSPPPRQANQRRGAWSLCRQVAVTARGALARHAPA